MFCSPYALLYRKIPKCPKTFGHDCSHNIDLGGGGGGEGDR